MASRAAHVPHHAPEPQLAERRLRPIYDLLDNGNNKKALQEVDKVLKKWPTLQCAKALKSLATLRVGRAAEALQAVDALAGDFPTEDSTLLVMTIVYRETHNLERICRMYEAAVEREPSSEELHTQLFMSYARMHRLEQQHRAAMTLYRLKSKNPHYFWGVISVVLQATRGDATKRSVLLTLAQRMIDKFISEGRLDDDHEIQLYLVVLRLQNKSEEALRFLDSPLGRQLSDGVRLRFIVPTLTHLGRWRELNSLSKSLLDAEPDRWDYYVMYLDSAVSLADGHDAQLDERDPPPDDTPEKCLRYIGSTIERTAAKARPRGPYLARLELYKRLQRRNADQVKALMGDASDLLLDYFQMFGHRACSVNDLRPYLRLVDEREREALAQRFNDTLGIGAVNLPNDGEQMQRHICSLQLGRMCGRQAVLDEEHARVLAGTLALHFEHAAIRPHVNPTERAPYDPYALLAAHLCYDLAFKCQSSKPLVEALYLLECALKNSPSNFHCKLLCIKFYHLLGCGYGAHSIYESLDVKHVQLDSLGYVHVALLGATGLHAITSAAYETTHKFFTHTHKDSIDHITYSYKYGSFMKIEELMDWRERLHGSLQRAAVLVEKVMLSLVMSPNHTTAVRSLSQAAFSSPDNIIVWEKLRDNRDSGVYTNWDSLEVEDFDAPSKQFDQDKRYARAKFLLLQCLVHCANLSVWATEKSELVDVEAELGHLESAIGTFDDFFRELQCEKFEAVNQTSVTSQLPSRLLAFLYSQMPFREIYCRAFWTVIYFFKNDHNSAQKHIQECVVYIDKCLQRICDILDHQTSVDDSLWVCRGTLENLVNFLEVVSTVTYIGGVCSDVLRQSSTTTKKTRKKNTSTVHVENALMEPINCLLDALSSAIDITLNKLNAWTAPQVHKDLSDHFGNLSLVILDTNIVTNKLTESHNLSLNTVKQMLKEKQKYISSISCS